MLLPCSYVCMLKCNSPARLFYRGLVDRCWTVPSLLLLYQAGWGRTLGPTRYRNSMSNNGTDHQEPVADRFCLSHRQFNLNTRSF
jgi:hypothetical protein